MTVPRSLHKTLGLLEYFTFGFGSMVGVAWVVLMDDWLGRGGPGGAMLGFLLGGLLLLPIARTYARLVRDVPDAGAEIAYTERVFPPFLSFATGWVMVLAYAIVCPWEAAAIGNLLARVFPVMNALPLYEVAGKVITAPRLVAGLLLTGLVTVVNYRGVRLSGRFQNVTTIGLLACFAVFAVLGFARGSVATLEPPFAARGPFISVLLVLQIVPYFMTGFESVAKGSEEARVGFDPTGFGRAITLALLAGSAFYVLVVAAVSFVYPWGDLVANHLGTEVAFARAFGSPAIARLILVAAFLSLFKVMNGNFMAATRMLFALGRRGLVHPSLSAVHPRFETPRVAIMLMAVLTATAAFLGDALLVPVTEVGSLAAGIGWCAACLTPLLPLSALRRGGRGVRTAIAGVIVSFGIVLMKVVPGVPGSFTASEWIAFGAWCALGAAFWMRR
ncbi:MAG TPA: APC family permease [Gemmatimonadales bacterium]|nr:APC family permease [Gemmatimonadales bacterium]